MNPNFKFYKLLLIPYCYGLACLMNFLITGVFTTSTSSRLFRVLSILAFFSAYPIFAKGTQSNWLWVGEWTMTKWLLVGLAGAVILLVF